MTKSEYIKHCNDLRKANKGKWCNFTLLVGDSVVGIKFYNTWVQVLSIDGIKHSSNMELSVKEFNAFLESALK